mgnify:CR=1 FL=1|jgi:Tfp pilus assembly protein PilO
MAKPTPPPVIASKPSLPLRSWLEENPKRTARIVLGSLLALNLIATLLLLEPFGGSPEGLEVARARMESQLRAEHLSVESMGKLAAKMQTGESEGAKFIEAYFLDQRRAASEILQTLDAIEQRVGIRPKGKTFGIEPIEGTEDYKLLTISANYEGTYGDLVEFATAIDHSERLLILDTLQAAPQRDDASLQIQAQLYGFVVQNNTIPAEIAQAVASTEEAPASAEEKP